MTADTTALSYWLNWRFSFCALFILTSMVVAAIIIWKFEGQKRSEHREVENRKESPGILYEDETWKTCLEGIHPAWLLGFRVFAFLMLLALLMANVVISGGGIFYFYTQWTFTLVTIYFGFGSAVSIDGCRKHCRKAGGDRSNHISLDSEQGTYVPPTIDEVADVSSNQSKHFDPREASYHPSIVGPWTYAFQIIYQICAGAVMLTDSVFWLIIFPFLMPKSRSLNFIVVCMHSINAVFLIGDTTLNCMRFPLFRIAYFILWTGAFVIFQWIIHACVNLWWPYPFLDLSSSYAPLWYTFNLLLDIIMIYVHDVRCEYVSETRCVEYGCSLILKHFYLVFISDTYPYTCEYDQSKDIINTWKNFKKNRVIFVNTYLYLIFILNSFPLTNSPFCDVGLNRYLGIGVMLIPCYGIFALIVKLKDFSLSRTFPNSYRKLR